MRSHHDGELQAENQTNRGRKKKKCSPFEWSPLPKEKKEREDIRKSFFSFHLQQQQQKKKRLWFYLVPRCLRSCSFSRRNWQSLSLSLTWGKTMAAVCPHLPARWSDHVTREGAIAWEIPLVLLQTRKQGRGITQKVEQPNRWSLHLVLGGVSEDTKHLSPCLSPFSLGPFHVG